MTPPPTCNCVRYSVLAWSTKNLLLSPRREASPSARWLASISLDGYKQNGQFNKLGWLQTKWPFLSCALLAWKIIYVVFTPSLSPFLWTPSAELGCQPKSDLLSGNVKNMDRYISRLITDTTTHHYRSPYSPLQVTLLTITGHPTHHYFPIPQGELRFGIICSTSCFLEVSWGRGGKRVQLKQLCSIKKQPFD